MKIICYQRSCPVVLGNAHCQTCQRAGRAIRLVPPTFPCSFFGFCFASAQRQMQNKLFAQNSCTQLADQNIDVGVDSGGGESGQLLFVGVAGRPKCASLPAHKKPLFNLIFECAKCGPKLFYQQLRCAKKGERRRWKRQRRKGLETEVKVNKRDVDLNRGHCASHLVGSFEMERNSLAALRIFI